MTHKCYFCKAETHDARLMVTYPIKVQQASEKDISTEYIQVCLICNAEHAEIYKQYHEKLKLEQQYK